MQLTGNTLLITGGASGIGRGLAEAFHALGNQVIIAGRRQQLLDEVTAANPGMASAALDIDSPEAVKTFAAKLIQDFPALNAVMHNAGIMRMEDLKAGKVEDADATIATNLLGPIRLNAALIGTLLAQPRATIFTVTSGLAYMPFNLNPTYCATKAALHSYTESLRYQLKDTAIQVIEIVPPYVRTGLTGERQANDPTAVPLDDYIAETMDLLKNSPNATEILVESVRPRRFAVKRDEYDAFYKQFNDTLTAIRAPELNK